MITKGVGLFLDFNPLPKTHIVLDIFGPYFRSGVIPSRIGVFLTIDGDRPLGLNIEGKILQWGKNR